MSLQTIFKRDLLEVKSKIYTKIMEKEDLTDVTLSDKNGVNDLQQKAASYRVQVFIKQINRSRV